MSEWHCTVDGTRYGPVSLEELLDWVQQGRLGADDLVWKQGMAEWQPARTIPELAGQANWPAAAATTRTAAVPQRAARQRRFRPHRGGTVLVLGILSWLLCFILGIFAWSMGNSDLREMNAGRMDPSGRGMVQAGRILGMIHVILSIVAFAFYFLMLAGAAVG